MKSHFLLWGLACPLFLSACETTIPAGDEAPTSVTITLPAQGNRVVASSDPETTSRIDVTCGPQTDLGVNAFVLNRGFPVRLMLTVGDGDGVGLARAIVIGGAISNVEPADATIRTGSDGAAVVEKFYDRADPRTGQVMFFDVAPAGGALNGPNTIAVNGVGADFNGNGLSSARTVVGTAAGLCGG